MITENNLNNEEKIKPCSDKGRLTVTLPAGLSWKQSGKTLETGEKYSCVTDVRKGFPPCTVAGWYSPATIHSAHFSIPCGSLLILFGCMHTAFLWGSKITSLLRHGARSSGPSHCAERKDPCRGPQTPWVQEADVNLRRVTTRDLKA